MWVTGLYCKSTLETLISKLTFGIAKNFISILYLHTPFYGPYFSMNFFFAFLLIMGVFIPARPEFGWYEKLSLYQSHLFLSESRWFNFPFSENFQLQFLSWRVSCLYIFSWTPSKEYVASIIDLYKNNGAVLYVGNFFLII